MKNLFTPIFAAAVVSLLVVHKMALYHGILLPFVLLAFGCALSVTILGWNRLGYGFISLSLVLLLTFGFLKERDEFRTLSRQPVPQSQYITINGRLLDYPEIKRDHSMITVQTRTLGYHRREVRRKVNVRCRVAGDLGFLNRGDTVVVHARVFRPRVNLNFYPSPFENYHLYKRYHLRGVCKSRELVRRVKKSGWMWQVLGTWRNRLRGVIEEKLVGGDGILDRRGVFLEAILMGDRGQMRGTQKEALLNSGMYHIFAISGAHIGIIALMSLWFLKILGLSFRGRILITLWLLVFFLAFSGFKVSALRAVIMAVFILAARLFHFKICIFNIISLSGLFILFVNPLEMLNPGFILTYALTMAIVIGRRIFVPRLRRLPAFIKEMVSANFTASLVSLPLSLHFFKRYSFAGFLAGLVLLPLTAVIIAFGMAMLLLASFSTTMAAGCLAINLIPLSFFFSVVDLFSQNINLSVFRASPSLPAAGAIFVLFACLGLPKKFRFQKGITLTAFLGFLLVITLPRPAYSPSHLEAYFLDVGQGDCQLVVFPGGDSLLIDGGGSGHSDFEVGKQLVLPFILQRGIRVKWVALSHFHPDHCRGVTEIINILNPRQLWVSSRLKEDRFYRGLMETIGGSIQIKWIAAPFTRRIAGCTVTLLAPARVAVDDFARNSHSQVIKISDPHHGFLFTGDIEKPVESTLAARKCDRLTAGVLKIPHHGSRTSSTDQFLDCVNPRVAVFSFSQANRFHFPHAGVLNRLRTRGIRWLTTARNGGIRIVSLSRGLNITVSR